MKSFSKKIVTFAFAIFTLLSSCFIHASTLPVFNKLVFFGDSLTDNGNLYRFTLGFFPKSPPYFEGRFSNGYVWAEYIAKHYYSRNFVSASNYSVGGQTAIFHNPTSGYLPYTLAMSINNYLVNSAMGDRSSSLIIIWIGANDYLTGLGDPEVLTTNVVNGIKTNIENLIYYGVKNFIVLNLPNLAKTPYGRSVPGAPILEKFSVLHNQKLVAAISAIKQQNPKVNAQLLDAGGMFQALIDDPSVFNKKYNTHISNTTESCWTGGYTYASRKLSVNENNLASAMREYMRHPAPIANATDSKNVDVEGVSRFITTAPALRESLRLMQQAEQGDLSCQDAEAYVFWDKVHPSSIVHLGFSIRAIEFINENFTKEG